MAVSKRLRYEVLRRDDFQCRYCHTTEREITVDHVIPQSLGGPDDPSNLVAACGDCNGGKTSSLPDATVVAAPTEDVLAWAQAMRQRGARELMNTGRMEFARELLAELGEEVAAHFIAEADLGEYRDEDDEPQTETQLACDAMSSALNSLHCDWDYLATRVEETLQNLPGRIGERALVEREDRLRELCGPFGRRTFRLTDALYIADDLLNLPTAEEYLGTLTKPERAEWCAYAAAVYHRANLDEDRLTSRAAHCAWAIADGGWWNGMCVGPGTVITFCPQRGTHYARIAGIKCCGPDGPPDHKGHLVCDGHLDELLDGTFTEPGGQTFKASDYALAGSDPRDF